MPHQMPSCRAAIVIVLLGAAGAATAQQPTSAASTAKSAETSDPGAEVLVFERAIGAAIVRGDVAYVERSIAPDFVMVHGDGWTHGERSALVDDRASFIKRVADNIYAALDYETQSVELHGDVAISYGRYVGHIPGSPPGRRWFYVWYEKVYARRDGRWVYLSHRTVDGAHYGESRAAVSLRTPQDEQ